MTTDAPAATKPHRQGGLVLVGMALTVWWPAFTLGAWGTLFFDQLLTIWVAATVGLLIVALQPRPVRHRLGKILALLVPSLWLALAFILRDMGDDLTSFLLDLTAIVIALVGAPFTLIVLIRIVWPDYGRGLTKRTRALLVVALAGVMVASFLLGLNHPSYLTCEDFSISGNSEPPGCVHERPDSDS